MTLHGIPNRRAYGVLDRLGDGVTDGRRYGRVNRAAHALPGGAPNGFTNRIPHFGLNDRADLAANDGVGGPLG